MIARYWCQGCSVRMSGKCTNAGHRSEELWLNFEDKWKHYVPPKVTEAQMFNGTIIHVKVS